MSIDNNIAITTTTATAAATENKQLILDCLALYSQGRLEDVVPLLREDYTDHGLPFQTSSREAWIATARTLPLAGMRIDIRSLVADGDNVLMLSRRQLPAVGLDIAVADVFRVQDGRIAERWEIVEQLAAGAADPLAGLVSDAA